MSPAELLKTAAAYVAEHGIIQGDLGNKGERCCMLGALSLASGARSQTDALESPTPEELAALIVVRAEVEDRSHEYYAGFTPQDAIAAWNDIPGRIADDVVEIFEGAAKRLP